MHLARHQISSIAPINILDARFDADTRIFTATTAEGFAIYRLWPLQLLRKREFTGGTLRTVLPLHTTSLLFLLGGGPSPLYPRNKVILWDDSLGRVVAELEFRNEVCSIACRRGWLAVAMKRRVVVFQVGKEVKRYQEWDTCENKGLVAFATAPQSTLLAIAGHRTGHVQLIHLPPCPGPSNERPSSPSTSRRAPRRPTSQPVSFIMAHTSAVTSLDVLPSGRLLATSSSQGTLVRIWDTHTGKMRNEFRRGTDKAEIYGVAFRPDEKEVAVWSDKGTVHVFSLVGGGGPTNRQSLLSQLTPYVSMPKYFSSEWSHAQFRLPSQAAHIALSAASKSSAVIPDERCTVAWIRYPLDSPTPGDNANAALSSSKAPKEPTNFEYQLIALTYSGGWYRLALPSSTASHSHSQSANTPTLQTSPRSQVSRLPKIGPGTSTTALSQFGMHQGRQSPIARPLSATGIGTSIAERSRAETGTAMGKGKLKGKGKERQEEARNVHECTLEEFRRFGRWDGWA